MSEKKDDLKKNPNQEEQLSLNDDRRVKVLSPGAMVAKRFFRNRVAVTGLVILAFMTIFSFIGGMVSPYKQDQLFYRDELQSKQFAAVIENTELRYAVKDGEQFDSVSQAQFLLATIQGQQEFSVKDVKYSWTQEGDNFYSIYRGNKLIAYASNSIVSNSKSNDALPFELQFNILKAATNEETSFEMDGKTYELDEAGAVLLDGEEVAHASPYVVQALMSDVYLSREFKENLIESIQDGAEEFTFTDQEGLTAEYTLSYSPADKTWSVNQEVATRKFDTYAAPNGEHWLGTDRNGMDMLTRLMYGGRVSLYIGFIVVMMSAVLGVILGGLAGYFGGWVDMLVMRIVDIFYCIPSMPVIIILGAAMDNMRLDPQIRMIYLMLILGILGWPSIARLVRGQILTLREQEFMAATEACGIRVSRRIFRHLVPNVIPQLIVTCTMSLGSTIITEATLSFLGLGVKFPFASWGNIINDVNDIYVLTNYWFVWIPAGLCLLLTVLAFNLVGDGLRDAFDPKMKR